ncbi:MAG TPA: hypothetical protein VJ828_16505, partial [Lacipirellulaceae bacterium]|nr:hypothetical protein [Lacipirellulaceae bacterium]
MRFTARVWVVVLFTSLTNPTILYAQSVPIRYRGAPAELAINKLSDRTLQIVLSPIDEATGEPRPEPRSSVLVEQEPQSVLRSRNLDDGGQDIPVGNLTVKIEPAPLSISLLRSNGDVVQSLRFDKDAGTISFRAKAPVLGMGEGAQQFDRRGTRYTMRDGWGAWERPTHGSWVAVPFLIGTDGWALLVHH